MPGEPEGGCSREAAELTPSCTLLPSRKAALCVHPHSAHLGAWHRRLQRQGRHHWPHRAPLCAWWHPCCSQRSSCRGTAGPWALSPWLPAHPRHSPQHRQCRGWRREDTLGQTSHKKLFPVAGWHWQLCQEPESVWPNSHNKQREGGRLQPMKKSWRDRKRTA